MNSFIKKNELSFNQIIIMLILAFFRTGSVYFMMRENNLPAYQQVILLISRFAVDFVLFATIMLIINSLTKSSWDKVFGSNGGKYHITLDYAILAVAWLPILLIKYPCSLNPDSWVMIVQYRTSEFTNHHSMFLVVVFGALIKLGELLGDIRIGLFILSLLSYALYVITFGYSLNVIRRLGVKEIIVRIVGLLYIINTYIISTIGEITKDNYYSVIFMAFILLVIDFSISDKKFPKYKYVLMVLSVMFACLIRKNGIYEFGVTIIVGLLANRKYTSKNIYMAIIGGVILCSIGNFALTSIYDAKAGNVREMLSIPFQQTARYVRDYSDEVTPEEREIIDSVLVYDTLADRYDPAISDPVKDEFTNNAENLGPYFGVWWNQFLKHPMCYVEATWEQNYYLFCPASNINNLSLSVDSSRGYYTGYPTAFSYNDGIYEDNDNLLPLKLWLCDGYYSLNRIPVISSLWNVSIMIYALVYISIVSKKHQNILYILMPLWMTVVFVIIGPVIYGHARYMFPVIYSMPAVIFYTLYSIRNKQSRQSQRKASRQDTQSSNP